MLPNNKLKLEVKSSETEVAKFISTENAELILQTDYTTTQNNYSKFGASLGDNSSNPFRVNAYFGTPDTDRIASFNVTNTDLSTTTIIRGNLIIDGSALSLGTYILNDETDEAFSNFPKSAYSNLISERYTSLLVSNITNTCNIISHTIDDIYTSLHSEVMRIYTLENLFKGISFTFFTDADFDNLLASKSLENLANGSRNKYIQNKVYPNDLVINTNLIASNFTVQSINVDKVYAKKLYGDGSRLQNIYKGDGTTSTIIEGSNLFYTSERVIPIIETSNVHASNYIEYTFSNLLKQEYDMHYNLSNYNLSTSNILYSYIAQEFYNLSNLVDENILYLYSYVLSCNLYTSNLSSNLLVNFSNIVDVAITDLGSYLQTTSNELASDLIYKLANISNYTMNIYAFNDDLTMTSNTLANILYDHHSNVLVSNIDMSEQNAIHYMNNSSNYIHENIIRIVADNSNIISLNFIDLYDHLSTSIQTALSDASIVEADLNAFINNSNDIQNALNTNTSNELVDQIVIGMSNITEYILQTDGMLSNLIFVNYEITSNNIENISNYIIAETIDITNNVANSMLITSNFIEATSNNIILNIQSTFDKQLDDVSADIYNISNIVANRIDNLTCDQIKEGTNKYFTTSRFYNNIIQLSLDDVQNGTTNRYIVNGIYDDDLTISCNLYASNLSIIGNDTVLMTTTIQTDALEILSASFAPALIVKQIHPTCNILEAYNYQNDLVFAVGQRKMQIGQSNIIYEPKDIVQEYIHYEFKSQQNLLNDSSGNNKTLTNYGGTYIQKDARNSILLTTGQRAVFASENWSTYENLTLSFWFNAQNFADGNIIIEFKNASANITVLQNAGQLTFQINSTVVYQAEFLENRWNHVLWNINVHSYISINGEPAQFYTKVPLTSVSYTNTLGSATNTGTLYVSDFRVITTPLNTITENLYAYTKDTYTVNVYGTAKANNFIGSGVFLYDVNLTDKTTSELMEDPNGTNLYFTDARANLIIDSSNIHMSNMIDNVSNLLATKQNTLITSEILYWTRTSNQITNFMRNNNTSQSNLILTTSNALMQKATSLVLNANQSNYVTTTSNSMINTIRRYDVQQSNYIVTASNALVTIMLQENVRTSNYVSDFSTKLRTTVNTDYRNVSNYISTTSNSLFLSFMLLQTQQSNYTSNISNLFVNSFPTYQLNTSNYILSVSNIHATSFVQNNINVSNYVGYSSNIVASRISQLIADPITGGQGQQVSTTYVNRWQEPEPYVTTFTVDTTAFNYIQYKDGNVGIGTSYPTATLEIVTANASLNSVKVNNNIWAQTGIISSSDARIKKDIVDIDDGDALQKIMSIQPKIYDYIDNHRHKNKCDVYGFIAQQIAQVIPNAISLQTEAIPNIYCFGTIYNEILMINDDIPNVSILEGMRIAVLCNKTKHIVTIDDIYSDNIYKIVGGNGIEGSVFVYGTVVHDFHTLDKNYIYTLNVCATQDLHRRQQEMFSNLERLNDEYHLNKLRDIDDAVKATKSTIEGIQLGKENIIAKYDELLAEYNRLNDAHSNYMSIITDKADISQVRDRITALKAENTRIQQENTTISSNNIVLRDRLADIAGKVSNIRNILQRNNII